MRVSFSSLENIKAITFKRLRSDFLTISKRYKMKFNFFETSKKQNVLIMVSKFGHCLNNLLYQWKTGSLNCSIPLIVSNHSDMKEIVKPYNLKYKLFKVNKINKLKQ